MNKINKLAALATAALTLAIASSAIASSKGSDYYYSAGIGFNTFKTKVTILGANTNKKETKPTFMVGFGKNLSEVMRADVTLDYSGSTKYQALLLGKQTISSFSVMANMYYHFSDIDSGISPYGMLGLGMGINRSGSHKVFAPTNADASATKSVKSKTKTQVNWKLGAGISGKLSDNMIWDLGYSYTNKGKLELFGVKSKTVKAHSILASVRMPL